MTPAEIEALIAPPPPLERGIFCNRTLNMRAIRAIGYDMDYTLIHYNVAQWERRAYEYLQDKLVARGWPVGELRFDPQMMVRGLVLDLELGNTLKANRFGYVKQASHGTQPLDFERQRELYGRTIVDLAGDRFEFVNTLFSVSEVCMYAQLVDMLDENRLPGVLGYIELYREVRRSLDEAHMEGQLKAEIVADPERFVELDEQTPRALLDQKRAGKRLMLITNSEWSYTREMMRYVFDRFLPATMTWRDLFEVVIVSARKPRFFADPAPFFEVVDEERGLLAPISGGLRHGGVYVGGNASAIEAFLELSGDQIIYVGDHIFADVHVSKNVLRWRTALILRELELELSSIARFAPSQRELSGLMDVKQRLEYQQCQLRLAAQRAREEQGAAVSEELEAAAIGKRAEIELIDQKIAPLARASAELGNSRWGLLMRAGNDKSHLARQVERYADIYTSRVSNFLFPSPFVYLRSPRGSLPHDPNGATGGAQRE